MTFAESIFLEALAYCCIAFFIIGIYATRDWWFYAK